MKTTQKLAAYPAAASSALPVSAPATLAAFDPAAHARFGHSLSGIAIDGPPIQRQTDEQAEGQDQGDFAGHEDTHDSADHG